MRECRSKHRASPVVQVAGRKPALGLRCSTRDRLRRKARYPNVYRQLLPRAPRFRCHVGALSLSLPSACARRHRPVRQRRRRRKQRQPGEAPRGVGQRACSPGLAWDWIGVGSISGPHIGVHDGGSRRIPQRITGDGRGVLAPWRRGVESDERLTAESSPLGLCADLGA